MDTILKKIKIPISRSTNSSKYHIKLPDKYTDYQHKDKIEEGVTFNLKSLGSILVTELEEEGQSYGDKISAKAVNSIVNLTKVSRKKLLKIMITVSIRGIFVIESQTKRIISDLDIFRICFCTADKYHGRVFAYIARNKENETMECSAFLCPKRKIAQAVTLTVAKSFKMAKELCDNEEECIKQLRQPNYTDSLGMTFLNNSFPFRMTEDFNMKKQKQEREQLMNFNNNTKTTNVENLFNATNIQNNAFNNNRSFNIIELNNSTANNLIDSKNPTLTIVNDLNKILSTSAKDINNTKVTDVNILNNGKVENVNVFNSVQHKNGTSSNNAQITNVDSLNNLKVTVVNNTIKHLNLVKHPNIIIENNFNSIDSGSVLKNRVQDRDLIIL